MRVGLTGFRICSVAWLRCPGGKASLPITETLAVYAPVLHSTRFGHKMWQMKVFNFLSMCVCVFGVRWSEGLTALPRVCLEAAVLG